MSLVISVSGIQDEQTKGRPYSQARGGGKEEVRGREMPLETAKNKYRGKTDFKKTQK